MFLPASPSLQHWSPWWHFVQPCETCQAGRHSFARLHFGRHCAYFGAVEPCSPRLQHGHSRRALCKRSGGRWCARLQRVPRCLHHYRWVVKPCFWGGRWRCRVQFLFLSSRWGVQFTDSPATALPGSSCFRSDFTSTCIFTGSAL